MRKRDAEKFEVTYESSVAQAEYILNRPRKESSMNDYHKAQRFLERQGGITPQAYRDNCAYKHKKPISWSRYRTLKTAYQIQLAERVSAAARSAQALHEQGEHKAAFAQEAEVLKIGRELAKQQPDYSHRRYRDGLGQAHPIPKADTNTKKYGKRKDLGKLNKAIPNWQLKILKELPDQYIIPIVLLNLTGCRPAELEKSVYFGLRDGQLVVSIKGAKVNQVSGQAERTMTFDPDKDLWAKFLSNLLKNKELGSFDYTLNKSQSAFRESHSRAVVRALGPKWKGKVGLYSYRHAFAADLKAAGYSAEKIALALGHCSDRSQAYYGMAVQSGGGGRGLEKVTASREVKESQSSSVTARLAESVAKPTQR